MTDPAERWKAVRIPVDVRGTLFLFSVGSTSTCTITELSLDGCRVRTDRDYSGGADARVEVSFVLNGAAFRVGGLTQWMAGERVVGVRFVGMSERRKADLRELLAEAEAEESAEAGTGASQWAEAAQSAAAARAQLELLNAELAASRAGEKAARRAAEAAAEQLSEVTKRLEAARAAHEAAERFCADVEARETACRGTGKAVQEPEAGPVRGEEVHAAAPVPPAPAEGGAAQAVATSRVKTGSVRGRERRRETRHAVDATAEILLLDARSTIDGRILDVSMSGCRIRCADKFPVGIYRRVEVEFVLDGLPFRLQGVVQSLHDRFTVGIRFLDLSERKRGQLKWVMEEITEVRREVCGELREPPES